MNKNAETVVEPAGIRTARRLYVVCAVALAGAYLSSGVTTIQPGEAAIVLRCGRLITQNGRPVVFPPGILAAWPEPFDRVLRLPIDREQIVELDFSSNTRQTDVPPADHKTNEVCFLTGDGNMAELRLRVKFRIIDPAAYALRSTDVRSIVAAASTSAATARLADGSLDDLLRLRRTTAGNETYSPAQLIQAAIVARLSRTPCGIEVTAVETPTVAPPREVVEAFDEVQTARIEQETHRQRVIGERHATVLEYEALSQQTIAEAKGALVSRPAEAEAAVAHFEADLQAYRAAPRTTLSRLHREAWSRVLAGGAKIYFVDGEDEGASLRLSIARPELRP
jgi:membrane protease subunit HflK